MLTQIIIDLKTKLGKLMCQDIFYHWGTAATAGTGLSTTFNVSN